MGQKRKAAILAGIAATAAAVAAAAALGGSAPPPPIVDDVDAEHGATVDVGIAPSDTPNASDASREIKHYVVTVSDSPDLDP